MSTGQPPIRERPSRDGGIVPAPQPEGTAVTCNDHQRFARVAREKFAYDLTVAGAGFVLDLWARRRGFRLAMER